MSVLQDKTLSPHLARQLVLDELFDLTLYERLSRLASGETKEMLEALVLVERGHLRFWQHFFTLTIDELNFSRRIKLSVFTFFARVFGEPGIHVVLEAIEIYGIRKYLSLWEIYKDQLLGEAVRGVLRDELEHEDKIVSQKIARRIHPERIRDIFLGFNDGLVEMLGAISGFFAAFQSVSLVLVAGFAVAVAGSLSMAAGAFAALSSEREIEDIETKKKRFFNASAEEESKTNPFASGVVVGISYFIGASIPIFPVFFGVENLFLPVLVSTIVIIIISYILAFLSGMSVLRRIGMNLVIVSLAVAVTYVLAALAGAIWGVKI